MKNKPNLLLNNKNKQIEEEIERVYTLGDSEIICHMVVDMILDYSYQTLRKNYLHSLLKDFTKSFAFQLIEDATQLNIHIQPEIIDTNPIIEFSIDELERPKQDNWASNKMNVQFSVSEPKPIINNEDNKLAHFSSANIKKFKGEFSKKKVVKDSKGSNKNLDRSNKKLFEIIEGLENEDVKVLNFENKKKGKTFMKNVSKDTSISNIVSKDKINESSQVELVPLTSECKIQNDIFFSKEEEKAIEIYFREKEAEKIRKKKIEEELIIEEERKKMKFKENNLNTLLFDKDGNLMKFYNPDPEKLPNIEAGKYIIRSEAELKEFKEKLRKKNKQEKTPKKKKKIEEFQESLPKIFLSSDNKNEEIVPEMNYQPDPIKSIFLSNGVDLTSYNMKKTSERFHNTNKMDSKQFYDLVKQYKPGFALYKPEENTKKKEKTLISEINEENINNLSNRMSNLYMILTTEDETAENEIKLNQNVEKYSTALRRSDYLISDRIKKRNLHLNNIKGGTYDDIIKTNSNFRIDSIEQLDNDEVYQNLQYYYDNKNKLKFNKKINWVSPKTHGDLMQELGRMTKYPRDRMSRNILLTTGKISMNYKDNTKSKK